LFSAKVFVNSVNELIGVHTSSDLPLKHCVGLLDVPSISHFVAAFVLVGGVAQNNLFSCSERLLVATFGSPYTTPQQAMLGVE